MTEKRFAIALFGGLFIYLVLRAIYAPMLHDEIATFYRYVHIREVFPWFSEWSANNHYLNSLLTLFSYEAFASSPLALRLANVVFFPVYFYYVWKISGMLRNRWLRYGLLISLLFAHNYFEFFGISRGYGISMALLMGGVWFTIHAMQEPKPKSTLYALVCIALATYANLTIMNSLMLITGLIVVTLLLNYNTIRGGWSHAACLTFFGLIPILFFVRLLFRLKAEDELYYGNSHGFFSGSLGSIVKLLTGIDKPFLVWIPVAFFVFAVAIYILKTAGHINKMSLRPFIVPEWVFFYLLIGNLAAIFLENRLFGVNYPEDRTGLYLYPVLTGAIFFALDRLHFRHPLHSLIPVIPFLFFPLHFFMNINISWSSLENQAIPDRFHTYVTAAPRPEGYPPTVQGYHTRVMRWAYKNFRTGTENSPIHFSGYPSLVGDFQIVKTDDLGLWNDYYSFVDRDNRSGFSLLERKAKLTREVIIVKEGIRTDGSYDHEYFDLLSGRIDSLQGESVYFGFKLEFIAEKKPFHGWVVVTVYDDHRNTLRYEFLPFDWYRTDWTLEGKPFKNGILVQELPEVSSTYVVYIWNIRKEPYQIRNATVEVFKLNKDY